jgi:hypothetical protein
MTTNIFDSWQKEFIRFLFKTLQKLYVPNNLFPKYRDHSPRIKRPELEASLKIGGIIHCSLCIFIERDSLLSAYFYKN